MSEMEYKVIAVVVMPKAQELQDWLNDLGKEGWSLAGVSVDNVTLYTPDPENPGKYVKIGKMG